MKIFKILIKIMFLIILLSVFLCIGYGYKSNNSLDVADDNQNFKVVKRDGIEGVEQPYPFIINDNDVLLDLKNYSQKNENGKFIYNNIDKLPESERKLLANNKDATEYIVSYLQNEPAPYTVGETVTLGRNFPYYIQWDKRWGAMPLGESTIAIGGCGPTTVAMAISGLKDDSSITPDKVSKIEDKNGYFTPYGTSWSFFKFIADYYDIGYSNLNINEKSIDSILSKNGAVIASVHPGKFTTVGHIVLIVGKDSFGNYLINDPNSYGRTIKHWSFNELSIEIRSLWGYYNK